MADHILVRMVVDADLGAYKALREQALEAHPEAFTSDLDAERSRSAESYRSRLAGPQPDGTFTLGAWSGERLVGAISCERDARAKVRHIGHLVGMMVELQQRGRGIGRTLLRAAIDVARGTPGLELLTLSVTSTNHAAIGLYRSAGFERYGSLERAIKIGSVYHAKDLMVLRLER